MWFFTAHLSCFVLLAVVTTTGEVLLAPTTEYDDAPGYGIGWMGAFAERRPLKQTDSEREVSQAAADLVHQRVANLGYALSGNATLVSFESFALLYRDFHGGQFVTYRGTLGTRYDAVLDASCQAPASLVAAEQPLRLLRHEVSIFVANGGRHVTKHVFYPVADIPDAEVAASENVVDQELPTSSTDTDSKGYIQTPEFGRRRVIRAEELLGRQSGAFASAGDSSGGGGTWTIGSYNIWNYNEPWSGRLPLIVEQLRAERPDIIAFQEVRYMYERRYGRPPRDGAHQVEDLARALPEYQYVFVPGMTYVEINYGTFSIVDEGVAIFSRWPIVNASSFRFSRNFGDHEDGHQRVCLRAEVQLPVAASGGDTPPPPPQSLVNVFVTHMTLSDAARRRNVVEFLRFADRFPGPQVFVGDFNMNPDGEALEFLRGRLELQGVSGNFRDAWLELYPESAGDISHGWTYTTLHDEPKKRIDFVTYRGPLSIKEMHVIENDPSRGLMPSDHRGLVARFASMPAAAAADAAIDHHQQQQQQLQQRLEQATVTPHHVTAELAGDNAAAAGAQRTHDEL